jgi:uncharacterized protein
MKIIVLSDIHGDISRARKALSMQHAAEVVIFCGDGWRDLEQLKIENPDKMFLYVKGNCDWNCDFPTYDHITLEGKSIYFTHGHVFHVKYGLYEIKSWARENKADIVLFGHTHEAVDSYEDGLYIMNPGSCSGYGASFGTIEIKDGSILTNIIHLD